MIKPIFGFDVTNDKKSQTYYGDFFVTKKLDENISKALSERAESLQKTVKDAKLPMFLTVIQYLGLLFGIMVIGPMFAVDGGFRQAITNAPVLCFSGIFFLLLGGVLWIVSKQKEKRVFAEQNADTKLEILKECAQSAYTSLGVPATAKETDILMFSFIFKDGKMKIHTPAMATTPFYNHMFKVYREDEYLRIADVETVYTIPLDTIKAIRTINKTAILPNWNKEEPFNRGEYKKYKLSSNNYGVSSKPYYVLEFEHVGELYGVYFPCFELPYFEELTGLKAIDPKAVSESESNEQE